MKPTKSFGTTVVAALAVAVGGVGVYAQGSENASGTSAREMQRGVPGVDVDLGASGRAGTNGVPGVDVDIGNTARNANGVPGTDVDIGNAASKNGVPGVDVDTRVSGAAGDSQVASADPVQRPIQDRN